MAKESLSVEVPESDVIEFEGSFSEVLYPKYELFNNRLDNY
jgi:hypothetical protein